MPDGLTRYVDELVPERVRAFDEAVAAASRRRAGRRLRAVAAVLAVTGLAGWLATRGGSDVVDQVADGPPDRIEVDGRDYLLDGSGVPAALRQSPDDPAVLVATVGARVTGLRPECRRYPVARVTFEDAGRVGVVVDVYSGQRTPEPECPQVRGDLLERTVQLAAPLGARDVVIGDGTVAVNVVGRSVPGLSPLRGTRSCVEEAWAEPSNLDYANLVRHDGRAFVNRDGAVVPQPDRGRELGRVACTLSGSYTPAFPGPLPDGTAAYVEVGTPWFAVRGRDDAIAAEVNGDVLLFVHDPTFD
ncbi:MAG: hypothetical protein Q8R60_12955 [Mycobacteriales bacterium]|nr:hypothetical protein [Mycobacteriales bacterium]